MICRRQARPAGEVGLTAQADSNAPQTWRSARTTRSTSAQVTDGGRPSRADEMRFWFRWSRFESWRRSGRSARLCMIAKPAVTVTGDGNGPTSSGVIETIEGDPLRVDVHGPEDGHRPISIALCPTISITTRGCTPRAKLVTSNVPTAQMVQVDQWQVDPHRKRGNTLRSGSDAAAGLCRCIRCTPPVDATKSDATSWHPMQPQMVISWSGA